MAKKEQDSVILAWCDNGLVDGKFMQGVTDVLIKSGIKFETCLRSGGNQIARQREKVIRKWYNDNMSEWILWVDSDVVLSVEDFMRLWNKKDAITKPLLTGVYFTSGNPEEPLMIPNPTVYNFVDIDGVMSLKYIDPLPIDKFIKVDSAGMGFVLMHRSVPERIEEALGNKPFFNELGGDKNFVGEDIYFFSQCSQAGVPLWCDTGATVPHMKRFSFDEHYYNAMNKGRRK